MMGLVEDVEVWLHRDPVDFRKQINGLVVLVEQELAADLTRPRFSASPAVHVGLGRGGSSVIPPQQR